MEHTDFGAAQEELYQILEEIMMQVEDDMAPFFKETENVTYFMRKHKDLVT